MVDFNMPRTRFVGGVDISEQYQKIGEEYRELGGELDDVLYAGFPIDDLLQRDLDTITHETVDLLQTVQTLLRVLAEKHGVDVQKVIIDVIDKNRQRGYYA